MNIQGITENIMLIYGIVIARFAHLYTVAAVNVDSALSPSRGRCANWHLALLPLHSVGKCAQHREALNI